MKSRKRILCIEDDRATLDLLAEVLEDEGFTPLLAMNGKDGVSSFAEQPDLVICDVAMPDGDGFFVINALRNSGGELGRTPFVFITAHGDRDTHLHARRRGCDHFITKPIDFELLVEIVRHRLQALDPSHQDDVVLTPREIETMNWVARGKSSADIAVLIGVSERTVNFHVNNVIQKLGVATRLQAAIQCAMRGMIHAEMETEAATWPRR